MHHITDQQTDKSQAVFCQAVEKLADKDFALRAMTMINSVQTLHKMASEEVYADHGQLKFPVTTMEDTIVSKLYFEHQREKLAEHQEHAIGSRLDTYLNLYEVPEDLFAPAGVKEASDESPALEPRYLLPSLSLCKVASDADLHKAADLFSREHRKLNVYQRVEFSRNYLKTASELQIDEYPTEVAKYAGAMDTDMQSLRAILEVRAAAATRRGMNGEDYTKLAFNLREIEDCPSGEDLTKLAEVIHQMDEAHGFTAQEYDRRMPCAYEAVFNKESKETDFTEEPVMAKAEIVAQFGEDALEAVEDADGNVDTEKLKLFRRMSGNV